jgi:chromosome segregation ATPase
MLFLVAALVAVPAEASLAAAVVQHKTAGDHPAVKIISLLQKLQAQVKEEGQAEAVEYAKFTQWCTTLIGSKEKAIKTHTEEIDVATASIKALTADIEALTNEIAELDTELTKDNAQKATAIENRNTENGEFLDAKADLESTVSALAEAISALEANAPGLLQTAAVKKALELIRIYAPKGRAQVKAFLQRERQTPEELNAPTQRTYDFKGGDIIETLKNLQKKFEDDLTEANKAETAAANSHSLADAAKQDEIDAATRAKETKTEVKARKEQDLASTQSDLDEATDARTTAQTVLDDTKKTCTQRASEWELRSSRREGEMKAMQEAMDVLSKVTGVRKPEDKGISFLQKADDPSAKIVNLLRQAAVKSKAKELTKLADKIAALTAQTPGSGVFDQIKNMIEKMVFHLMAEQKDEDDHKNWCDLQLDQTEKMIEDKNTTRDQLEVDILALQTEIETLSTGIKENAEDVSELDTSMEELTTERNADKAENSATLKDAQDAQTAIAQAIAVLEDFYKSTGGVPKEDWELAQVKTARRVQQAREDPPAPETFSGDYTGTEGGTGVIDLLTDVASDFASMEALARSDETTQQDSYDQSMTAMSIEKASKQKDSEMKEARKETLTTKLMGKTKDQDHNNKELDATNKYWENLQPACVHGDSTYTDRKAARTQEIEALKQAQTILQDAFAEEK